MNKVLDIVTSKGLTYEQKVVALAHAAENSLEVLDIPDRTRHYMETGAICDLDEDMPRTGRDISCRITRRL